MEKFFARPLAWLELPFLITYLLFDVCVCGYVPHRKDHVCALVLVNAIVMQPVLFTGGDSPITYFLFFSSNRATVRPFIKDDTMRSTTLSHTHTRTSIKPNTHKHTSFPFTRLPANRHKFPHSEGHSAHLSFTSHYSVLLS